MSAVTDDRRALSVALERSGAWLAQSRQVPRDLCGTMMEMLALLLAEPMVMSALAMQLRVATASVTGLADRAERLWLVERRTTKMDRRVVFLELTTKGRELVMDVFSEMEVVR